MPSFIHHLRRTTPKAKRIFAGVVICNSSIIIWVHWDQKAQMRRMHAGVELDAQRLEQKLLDTGIDQSVLHRDVAGYYTSRETIPDYAKAKNHQPVPPEDIPELASLGVTRDSTFVPGMDRPDVDIHRF
eukprot:662019_1